MKRLLIVLSLTSSVVFQSQAASISARLNGQHVAQAKSAEKASKVIVACACDDLFPALQEVLMQGQQEIESIVQLKLHSMNLNKNQLNSIKLIVKDAAPLMLEGADVCADLLKKHGKGVVSIYKKVVFQMLIAGESLNELNPADQETLEGLLELVADDAQFNQFMNKLAAFNEKWAESFAHIMEASAAHEADVAQVQEALQNVLEIALNNKRAVGIQASLIPVFSAIKTQTDVIQIVQACLNELETKLPHVVVSSQAFVKFAVPFLATVITQSVDQALKSMPA